MLIKKNIWYEYQNEKYLAVRDRVISTSAFSFYYIDIIDNRKQLSVKSMMKCDVKELSQKDYPELYL